MLAGLSLHAQEADTKKTIIEDGWVKSMSNKIAVDISYNNDFHSFKVNTDPNNIELYPNTPTNLLLTLNYEFIAFGIQFSPDFLPENGDEDVRGKTKSLHLTSALVFRHWFAELGYQNVRGFYLKNTNDFTNLMPGEPFIQFPDLHHQGFSLTSGYIHNSKFSLRSLTTQTERQLKSVGSFIPVFNLDYYVVNDKSGAPSTQKSKNLEATVGPGYAYTFVFNERFYISLGAFTSVGYLNTKLTTRTPVETFNTTQNNFVFRWNARSGLGYNGDRFYGGLYTNMTGINYKQENTTALNFEQRVYYHLFFGMRFNAPNFLKRQIKKLKNI